MSHYSEILQLIFCGRPGPERAPLPLHGVDAPVPQDSKFSMMCCQHFLTIKKAVARGW